MSEDNKTTAAPTPEVSESTTPTIAESTAEPAGAKQDPEAEPQREQDQTRSAAPTASPEVADTVASSEGRLSEEDLSEAPSSETHDDQAVAAQADAAPVAPVEIADDAPETPVVENPAAPGNEPEQTSESATEASQSTVTTASAVAVQTTADPEEPSVVSASSDQTETEETESLTDTDNTTPEPVAPPVDYTNFTKEELSTAIEAQLQEGDVQRADAEARRMRPFFDLIFNTEQEVARHKYLADGGEADGFEFRPDATHERFLTAYRQIQTQKKSRAADQRKQRENNLETKQRVLDSLRELVDNEETQVSMNRLRELQNEWKASGPVPPQHNRSLWANYHALLDRFYDKRGIYFELKELDRRKNLEAKLALSARAEALVDEPDLRKAVSELDELHEEYKHIGPVPKDDQEPTWQRFKTASDKIHDRRREKTEKFKEELEANLVQKQQLIQEVSALSSFSSDSIKEWNQKTKEVQDIKTRWEAVGSMPRKQAKRVNKEFWAQFKQFFAHKGEFFKQLDAERAANLEKKEALVAQAESLKESEDWKTTGQELKRLQQEWKTIGPVPGKVRESVYRRFKAACDEFFDRRRGDSEETEAEYAKNLRAKEQVCEQIEQLSKTEGATQEQLIKLTDAYAGIGFVPRQDVQPIQKRFDKAVKSAVQTLEIDDAQKQKISAEVELSSLKASPGADRKIEQKENQLRRKINQMEDEIALWGNNLSFFGASKGAEKLKADFEEKIAKAQQEVVQLKAQLRALRSMR